ncbi:TPA: hypothetical protein I8552_004174 [Serratia marcescens]|nr:hypothetical protein [Serratia marcescens]HEJ9029209.1 hypothetical protein [Serratia marcescens]
MDNKLSELSKPVAEVVSKFGDPEAFGEREIKLLTGIQQMAYGTKFYSQEYVSALIQRAERLDSMLTESVQALKAAEKRLAESSETTLLVRDEWQKEKERADAAEKRLATSVRLPAKVSAQDMRETFNYLMDAEEAQAAANGFNQGLMESRKLLHEQGFTVEGDE